MTVAKAAPTMPKSKIKIKMGSRMVLAMAPITIQTMEYLGLPSARIKLLMPFVTIKNGIPAKVMPAYCCAKGSTSVVAPNSRKSGLNWSSPMAR